MQQRVHHRPTILIHNASHATPSAIATARRAPPARPSLYRCGRLVGNTLRYLLRHPLVALTIVVSCLLLIGTIGEAQTASQLDAQITQTRAQNDHISQQIAQTNTLIVQLNQDSAIIVAALKLGYVMPTGGANP